MEHTADVPAGSGGGRKHRDFVPADFRVPQGTRHGDLRLEPLGPQHNDRDYRAWTSSMEHIQNTPGFETYPWPTWMSLEDNKRDLVRHAKDFRERSGFTYSVMIGSEVVGCVYIYPGSKPRHATVRSWVSKDHADLDRPLYELVSTWLAQAWPFDGVSYAPRDKEHEFVS